MGRRDRNGITGVLNPRIPHMCILHPHLTVSFPTIFPPSFNPMIFHVSYRCFWLTHTLNMRTLWMRCLENLGIFETSTSHFPIQPNSISHKFQQYHISNTSTGHNLHGLYVWMHMMLYARRLKGNRRWKKRSKSTFHSYFMKFVKQCTIYRYYNRIGLPHWAFLLHLQQFQEIYGVADLETYINI